MTAKELPKELHGCECMLLLRQACELVEQRTSPIATWNSCFHVAMCRRGHLKFSIFYITSNISLGLLIIILPSCEVPVWYRTSAILNR